MSTSDPTKWVTQPGNASLTFVTDLAAHTYLVTLARLYVEFNRSIGSTTSTTVRARFGVLEEPTIVVGSTKFGIDLERPNWRFRETAARMDFVSVQCLGFVRRHQLVKNDPRLDMTCVITQQKVPAISNPELICSPPFVWRDLFESNYVCH